MLPNNQWLRTNNKIQSIENAYTKITHFQMACILKWQDSKLFKLDIKFKKSCYGTNKFTTKNKMMELLRGSVKKKLADNVVREMLRWVWRNTIWPTSWKSLQKPRQSGAAVYLALKWEGFVTGCVGDYVQRHNQIDLVLVLISAPAHNLP